MQLDRLKGKVAKYDNIQGFGVVVVDEVGFVIYDAYFNEERLYANDIIEFTPVVIDSQNHATQITIVK